MVHSFIAHVWSKSRRRFHLALLVAACVILFSSIASGQSSLRNYRARIHDAGVALDSLTALSEDGEDGDALTNQRARTTLTARTFEEIRAQIPPREAVRLAPGDEFETDNRWLHDSLTDLSRRDFASDSERAAVLAATAERLRAIEERLAEVETASSDGTASEKAAAKARLELILRRAEYNQGTRTESALARFVKWLIEQLQKMMPNIPRIAPGGGGTLIPVVQVLIVLFVVISVVALLTFLVRKLAPLIQNRRRKKVVAPKARVILGETIDADKSAADLLDEAERWAQRGDLRTAIRKAYIALLCELGDRKILPLAQHKTNRDYLRDVAQQNPHGALYAAMQPLVFNFERHWYGFYPASETDWQNFRAHCRKAVTSES